MKKSLITTFWVLMGMFIVILCQFFVPVFSELFRGSLFFLSPILLFSLLGGLLIFLTRKEKVEGKLKKFLILTGASAAGFFIFVLLHNLFYAFGVIAGDIIVLRYLMEIFHATFFLVAIFVCPLGFLIGAIGSIVIFFHAFSSRT